MDRDKGFWGSWKRFAFFSLLWFVVMLLNAASLFAELAKETPGDVSLKVVLVLLNAFLVAYNAIQAGMEFRNDHDN